MAKIVTTISLEGPLFTHDPAKTFQQNVEVLMAEVAKQGEEDVRAKMQQGEGGRDELSIGGRVSERVRGRVESLSGKHWRRTAVVGPDRTGLDAKDAIALFAAASRIEGETRPFKRSLARMRRAKTVTAPELMRGLG